MPESMVCLKCVLPEHQPEIRLNEEGICNICVLSENQNPAGKIIKLAESELIKILDKFKGKSKYDCLVMCSGGKDSIASLYYVRNRYKLKPLVFTFDNGFEDTDALRNVKSATGILKVDWLYFKSDYMKEMYAEMVRSEAGFSVCMLCSLWYMQEVYRVAGQHNLKLIIGGWTSGQLNIEENEIKALTKEIPVFIELAGKKYAKYRDFPKSTDEVKKKYRIAKEAMILSPHWFLPYTSEEYTETIKKELGWLPVKFSYPKNSSNCAVNFLGSYLSLKRLGFTHFHVEMSKLIRCGKLSRLEALKALEISIINDPGRCLAASALKRLGCENEGL